MSSERVQAALDAITAAQQGKPSAYLQKYRDLTAGERLRVLSLLELDSALSGQESERLLDQAVREHRRRKGFDDGR